MTLKSFLITHYPQPSRHGTKQEHMAVSASLNDGAQQGAISKGAQRCPVCAGEHHSFVKTRALYQCTACRRQTSVIAGTIFAATKVPLCTWFRAMYHLTQSKGGISSIELGRRLGVTQTTAWKIKHKLMQAMMEGTPQSA